MQQHVWNRTQVFTTKIVIDLILSQSMFVVIKQDQIPTNLLARKKKRNNFSKKLHVFSTSKAENFESGKLRTDTIKRGTNGTQRKK